MNRPLVLFLIGIVLIGAAFLSKAQAAEPILDAKNTKVEYSGNVLTVKYAFTKPTDQSNEQIALYQKGANIGSPIGLSPTVEKGKKQGEFTVTSPYKGQVEVAVVTSLGGGKYAKASTLTTTPVAATVQPNTSTGTGIQSGSQSGTQTTTTGTIGKAGEKRFKDTLFAGPNNDAITAGDYLYRLYVWAVTIAILGATAVIIRAGYIYATGRGNPSAITSAKELIVNALVGLALLILSYSILRFILGPRVKNQEPPKASSQTQQNSTQTNLQSQNPQPFLGSNFSNQQ